MTRGFLLIIEHTAAWSSFILVVEIIFGMENDMEASRRLQGEQWAFCETIGENSL